MRVGVLGVEGDGLLVGGDGLVVAAQVTVHVAQPVVRVGVLGVQGDGLLIGGDGLSHLSCFRQSEAQSIPSAGLFRQPRHYLSKDLDSHGGCEDIRTIFWPEQLSGQFVQRLTKLLSQRLPVLRQAAFGGFEVSQGGAGLFCTQQNAASVEREDRLALRLAVAGQPAELVQPIQFIQTRGDVFVEEIVPLVEAG